ncbi:unnamed protein product, partial [Prorocentrum cordatum]
AFTKRCREDSECETAMRGGDLAGDLGWLDRDPKKNKAKVPAAVVRAAFALQVGQVSDIVVSERGVHVITRRPRDLATAAPRASPRAPPRPRGQAVDVAGTGCACVRVHVQSPDLVWAGTRVPARAALRRHSPAPARPQPVASRRARCGICC